MGMSEEAKAAVRARIQRTRGTPVVRDPDDPATMTDAEYAVWGGCSVADLRELRRDDERFRVLELMQAERRAGYEGPAALLARKWPVRRVLPNR